MHLALFRPARYGKGKGRDRQDSLRFGPRPRERYDRGQPVRLRRDRRTIVPVVVGRFNVKTQSSLAGVVIWLSLRLRLSLDGHRLRAITRAYVQ